MDTFPYFHAHAHLETGACFFVFRCYHILVSQCKTVLYKPGSESRASQQKNKKGVLKMNYQQQKQKQILIKESLEGG